MEITLREKDMEALAGALAARIEERVIGKLLMSPSYDALSELARRWATLHIDSMNFEAEAVGAVREALVADGEKLLRGIVMDAVRKVRADDPDLRKAVARGVYEAARDHAESLKADDE